MDLADVANGVKNVPDSMINEAANGLTDEFIDYVLPLIQGEPKRVTENGVPRFAELRKVVAK